MPQGNQQIMDSAPDESPFQQVIPSILQQSLYPSLAPLGTCVNTAVSPPIPFSRRVINDIEEQQRKALKDTVEGNIRSTNTSPTFEVEEQEEEVIIPTVNPQAGITQVDTQEDPMMQDDQMSKASQDDNYHTAIRDDDLGDTVQFGNPVTQPFLSRSVRVPTTEVGCLSFTQMFQYYLHEYPPPLQADAYLQIQEIAQRLDVYLNRYPVQYINCMTSNS